MIPQADGSTESKPTGPPATLRTIRTRIAKAFNKKKPHGTISTDNTSDDYNGDVEIPDPSPIRIVSPRSTDAVPTTPKSGKSRNISFRNRHSKTVKGKEQELVRGDEGEQSTNGKVGHVPVTDLPTISTPLMSGVGQIEKEKGIGMEKDLPASPSKGTALYSHPVEAKEGSGSSESNFETPGEVTGGGKEGIMGGK